MEQLEEYLPQSFWDLVELARTDRGAYEAKLEQMSEDEIIDFYSTYQDAAAELKGDDHIVHMNPDLSEDGVDNVAMSVVAKGRDEYLKVLEHPESIPKEVERYPAYAGAAARIYSKRFKKPIGWRERQHP